MHDVEATLHQAAQIGEGYFCLLALGAHRPDLLDGTLLDPVQVVAGNEAAEVVAVARHQGRSYSADQGAALLRPAGRVAVDGPTEQVAACHRAKGSTVGARRRSVAEHLEGAGTPVDRGDSLDEDPARLTRVAYDDDRSGWWPWLSDAGDPQDHQAIPSHEGGCHRVAHDFDPQHRSVHQPADRRSGEQEDE